MRTTARRHDGTTKLAAIGVLLLATSTACNDARVEPTVPREPRPAALIADLDDQPSPGNPGFVADLAVATALTVPLTQPVWDPEAQQWVTSVNTGAPGEYVHVEAGYNPRGSARVLVSGSGGAEGETVPVAGLLRGTTMQQQDANGAVLTSDEPGAIIGAQSPAEWFGANPVTGVPEMPPPTLPMLGSVVLSDSVWRAARAGASESARAEDHGERRVLARRIGAMRARSTYAPIRGTRSGEPAWVLAHVELQLDHGGPRPATADIEIRRLAIRSNPAGNVRAIVTEEYAVGDVVPGRIVSPEDEPDPPPPPPPPPPGQPPAPTPPAWPNGIAPVVFQHGFGSSGATWTLMRDRLRPALAMRDIAWTLATPGNSLGSAADQFAVNRDAFSPTPVAVVAHSAGGPWQRGGDRVWWHDHRGGLRHQPVRA
ncbi:MAG: hypothetical protein MUE41_18585 [Gemmatimonadaceae bacterium]|jgi:hypothetical protein|nr:hypothetical protein [Gemmatimonadaceae bacterium]